MGRRCVFLSETEIEKGGKLIWRQWFAVEPELGVFNYSMGSVVANLAKKNKQILRCHNLVWFLSSLPQRSFPSL